MKAKHVISLSFFLLCALVLFGWFWNHARGISPLPLEGKALTITGNVISALKREKQMLQDIEQGKNEWRTPIKFYGKVVDENNQPVEGTRISFGWTDLSTEGYSRANTTSDSNGLFSLQGKKGKHLSLKVEKEGYYTSNRDNNNFTYAGENVNFVPDARNPILFHLRKKGAAEPLVAIEFPGFGRIAQLPRNGSTVEIDLLKGTIVPLNSGQLKMEFHRDPVTQGTKKFNWKCELTIQGGGFIETQEEFNFEAPKDGYTPSIEIDMPVTQEKWQTEIKRKYFIQLPNGTFGRIEFDLLAWNGVYTIHSYINPSDSRNLEFDPSKAIRPSE